MVDWTVALVPVRSNDVAFGLFHPSCLQAVQCMYGMLSVIVHSGLYMK